MKRWAVLLFCFLCTNAASQPSWLLHKSYADKFHFTDSMARLNNDVPKQVEQIKGLAKWAKDNGDIELAGILTLFEFKKSMNDERLSKGLSEDVLLDLAITANKKKLGYLEADVLETIGYFYETTGKNIQATEKFLTAYQSYKDFDPAAFPAKHEYLHKLGSIYYHYDDFENALKYFGQALATPLADKYDNNISLINTIGLCYRKSKVYDSAELYFRKVYDLAKELNERQWVGIAAGNIGITYYYQARYDEAIPFIKQDIEINGLGSIKNTANSMAILGSIYYEQHKIEKAQQLVKEALSICEDKSFWPDYTLAERIFSQLSKVYAAQNNMRLAYLYADSALAAKDSVAAKHNVLNLSKAQEKADFLQNELKTEHLKNLKRIQEFRRNILVAGIIAILIIGILIINRQLIKRRQLEAEKKHAESELDAASIKLESFREIDAQKKLVEEKNIELSQSLKNLEEAQAQLVQAEKMASLGQLTAGIAHEINNPVNFVSASIDPLRKDVEDIIAVISQYENVVKENAMERVFEKVETFKERINIEFTKKETSELLKGMEEGAFRTADIVRGLRNFSRLDQNVWVAANLNEGIESTVAILHPVYRNRVRIIREYGDLPEINCFPGQLNQVFMNILSNALQAIAGEGEIFIKTMANDTFVKVFIRDTGCGMGKETLSKIFDPFYTTKEIGKGTGLGLSISYGIIEKHKGTIEVFSELKKGTEFIITIPVTQEI